MPYCTKRVLRGQKSGRPGRGKSSRKGRPPMEALRRAQPRPHTRTLERRWSGKSYHECDVPTLSTAQQVLARGTLTVGRRKCAPGPPWANLGRAASSLFGPHNRVLCEHCWHATVSYIAVLVGQGLWQNDPCGETACTAGVLASCSTCWRIRPGNAQALSKFGQACSRLQGSVTQQAHLGLQGWRLQKPFILVLA